MFGKIRKRVFFKRKKGENFKEWKSILEKKRKERKR